MGTIRSYVEVPVDTLELPGFSIDTNGNGAGQIRFTQSPNPGTVWLVQRISVATSDASTATWSVYLPRQGTPNDDLVNFRGIRDRQGPASGGSFPYDPPLRVLPGRYIIVRGQGFTVNATIAATVEGLLCRVSTGAFDEDSLAREAVGAG